MMNCTVLEALENAQLNFANAARFIPGVATHPMFVLAKNQLDNALAAIDNGKALGDVLEP